ncbi:MAG: YciI family protein [Methylocystis sp.]|uniref:YciI family protein n=1 Tax=Methylocystis sp. TaxID=1911079 RepID=UPI003DA3D008
MAIFLILLSYTKPLDEVDRWLDDHKAWVKQGFDDGVFVLSGGQRPRVGGAIIAVGDTREQVETRAAQDPFIDRGVATAQVIEVRPSTVDERVSLLRDG